MTVKAIALLKAALLLGSVSFWVSCNQDGLQKDKRMTAAAESDDFLEADVFEESKTISESDYRKSKLVRDRNFDFGNRRFDLWEYVQKVRRAKYQDYINENYDEYLAFTKAPITYNGAPAIIFQLLPKVMPDIAGPLGLQAITGLAKDRPDDALPWGMAFTSPPQQEAQTPSLQLVTFSCAACHSGEISLGKNDTERLIGAPSTRFDINGYRSLFALAVNDERFVIDEFRQALINTPVGELYGEDYIQQEMFDRAVFLGNEQIPEQGSTILAGFKTSVNQRSVFVANTIGAYSYQGDLTLLKSSPGHVEAFGFATLAVAPAADLMADPVTNLPLYFKPFPSVADIMSVWRQQDRELAQWDGNLRAKLIRNLGAELGVAGDPRAVNFQNGILTTNFTDELPAPVYPFPVDVRLARKGKKIYQKACASCHEAQLFMPVDAVGTEPGRARGMTAAARLLLVENLKIACSDKTNPDCNAKDEDIIVPRQENPGYLALPLDGIWARAPYLHNGSVPTMYQLLVPESRPQSFYTGSNKYDKDWLGFEWQEGPYLYDTSIVGYSNAGHDDIETFNGGIDFGKDRNKLDALIEYLKTL